MTGKPPHDEVLGLEDLHVTVHDGAATAVRGVSLSVAAGEIVGLVGESAAVRRSPAGPRSVCSRAAAPSGGARSRSSGRT